MFFICSKGFKINLQNRKWNYFSHFPASDEKSYFTKCFSFDPRGSKSIFKTWNGIIQTGNRIISPTSRLLIKNFVYKMVLNCSKGLKIASIRPLIKKVLLQNVSHLFQLAQNWFSKQEMELSKQEMELLLSLPGLWSKKLFYKMFLIWSKGFKINFQNRKWNYPNRRWNYIYYFQA